MLRFTHTAPRRLGVYTHLSPGEWAHLSRDREGAIGVGFSLFSTIRVAAHVTVAAHYAHIVLTVLDAPRCVQTQVLTVAALKSAAKSSGMVHWTHNGLFHADRRDRPLNDELAAFGPAALPGSDALVQLHPALKTGINADQFITIGSERLQRWNDLIPRNSEPASAGRQRLADDPVFLADGIEKYLARRSGWDRSGPGRQHRWSGFWPTCPNRSMSGD